MSTAAKFNRRLHDSIVQCISLGYRPSDFIEMLDKTEGVSLAKKLVATGKIQSGLKRVKALGRPDLAKRSGCARTEQSSESSHNQKLQRNFGRGTGKLNLLPDISMLSQHASDGPKRNVQCQYFRV
jgi:hypothetical protein